LRAVTPSTKARGKILVHGVRGEMAGMSVMMTIQRK